jgi:uncharacterized membrane protein (UPF0182 family)
MIALVAAAFLAIITGLGMMAQWTTFALYWNQVPVPNAALDPVFGRPATFYLFTLPVAAVASWATTHRDWRRSPRSSRSSPAGAC